MPPTKHLTDLELEQFKAWLSGQKFADRPFSDSTVDRYFRSAGYFLQFCIKSRVRSLDEANAAWLRNWLYSEQSDGKQRFSASTRIIMQSALNLLFYWAQELDFATDNPIEKLRQERAADRTTLGKGGRKSKRLPKVLSWEDQEHLLSIAQANPREFTATRDACLLALTLATGLRREELCSLVYSDVHWQAGRLRVVGKGDKERLVSFEAAFLAPYVEDWLRVRTARGMDSCETFFTTNTGAPMTPNLIYQQVSHYLSLLENETGRTLPAKGSHLLRHTSASAQLAKGVPVTQVQANLGHDGLATLQIYAHLLPAWKSNSNP